MKYFSKLEILGYRGYATNQTLQLAQPNGLEGSGITSIVGANNSGKSSVYEAFRMVSNYNTPALSNEKRNKKAGDRVDIRIYDSEGNSLSISSIEDGASETKAIPHGMSNPVKEIFCVPSRRHIPINFSQYKKDRADYIQNTHIPFLRTPQLDTFEGRLFLAQSNRQSFDPLLERILGEKVHWNIDMGNNGGHYLNFRFDTGHHSSDGAGEGLLSVFAIVDALYDSSPGDVIVIDEPELSLHPRLQKKILEVFMEYAKDRQVIIATHSPYFINWQAIVNGGEVARVTRSQNGSEIYRLQRETVENVATLLNNYQNPHILGLQASEVFFLEDRVVVTEGQEDVVFLKIIMNKIGIQPEWSFYGWGAGGAGNIEHIVRILSDLNFNKVSIILDKNETTKASDYIRKFPKYCIKVIPTDDVRSKDYRKEKAAVIGLIDKGGKQLNSDHIEEINTIFSDINKFMNA